MREGKEMITRLTKVMHCDDGNKLYDYSNEVVREHKDYSSRLKLMFEKLAYYEDLEEQGLLLKLPCKIGTEVYCISEIRCKHYLSKDCWNCLGDEFANSCYEPDRNIRKYAFVIEMLDDFGETVFLTKEEAEEALLSM